MHETGQELPAPSSASGDEEDSGPRIHADLTRMLYDQAPMGLIVTGLNACLVALGVAWVSHRQAAALWLGGMLLALASRGLLVYRYRRGAMEGTSGDWARRYGLGAAVTALGWGLVSLLLGEDQLIYEVVLGFVISGMVSGALISLSPILWTYRVYLLGALVPYGLQLVFFGNWLAFAMTTMLTLFGIFMWVSAQRYRDTLHHSLELGHANLDLVADLTLERYLIAGLNRDLEKEVRERRQVQDALVLAKEGAEAASVAKSQFLANMSHEIRTPMNGVLGMLEMLAQTELDDHQRGYVDTARSSAESLLTVINDILDFSKIEANKLELESIPFDARLVAEDVVSLFAVSAEDKGVELACFIDTGVKGRVVGDPTRLRQVLANILGNAVKFTERGEVLLKVQETVERPGRTSLCFEVTDTGIGMSQDQLGRLFAPFVQADGSTTRRFGGSGLGLSITKSLVDMMGGTLEVASDAGQGSRFAVRIPFVSQSALAEPPEPRGLVGRRMLAVDDHPINLDILAHYLTGWGVHVECVPGASAALARMREQAAAGSPFEVAILDMQMPEMDGLALARAIRAEPALNPVRLVLLSSMGHPAVGEGLELDMTLVKPIRRTLLRDALLQVVDGLVQRTRVQPGADLGPLVGRVLLAEDNAINQKVACGMLHRLGLEVDVADDGIQALRRLDTRAYDLVLMDVQMPTMDGFAATRALRLREHEIGLPRVPVIAMTANAMTGDRDRCLEAGMDDYIAKPVKLAELRRTLSHWLPAGPA